jgi:hypothetical protein
MSIPGGAPPPFRDENLVVPVALIRGADLLLRSNGSNTN